MTKLATGRGRRRPGRDPVLQPALAAGLSAHFRAVADSTDLPVILYDIPVRSGRRIGAALTLELARQVPNIVGVKDATGDVAGTARWWPRAPTGSRSTAATTR